MKPPRTEDVTLPCRKRPDLYLTDDNSPARVEAAKRHCLTCPVLQRCAEWAIGHELHLVWGATSPHDRERIRRERGIGVEQPSVLIDRPYRKASAS